MDVVKHFKHTEVQTMNSKTVTTGLIVGVVLGVISDVLRIKTGVSI